jgi:hypothetical protein
MEAGALCRLNAATFAGGRSHGPRQRLREGRRGPSAEREYDERTTKRLTY